MLGRGAISGDTGCLISNGELGSWWWPLSRWQPEWAAALLLVSIDAGGGRAYSRVVLGANMDMVRLT